MRGPANYITISRIVFSVLMVIAAPFSSWFWLCYVCGGLSDVADGFAARALKQQSAAGAKLDSIADMVFAAAILVFAIREMHFPHWIWIAAACIAVIRLASYGIGFWKFKTFSALHTYANKATGALIFAFPLLTVILGTPIAAGMLCFTGALSSLEELMITVSSRELDRDRKSILIR